MPAALSAVGSLAVVAVAIGALAWALGQERAGKRAVAFGIALGVVGEALARNGCALLAWADAHRTALLGGLIGAAVLAALLRAARPAKGGAAPGALSKKRRVEGGP